MRVYFSIARNDNFRNKKRFKRRDMVLDLNHLDPWNICYIIMLFVMGLISFCTMKADKTIAIKNGQYADYNPFYHRMRHSECKLHTYELLGGFVGSFLAQHIYRHKIKKASYQIKFWIIVAIHCYVIYLQYNSLISGEISPSNDNSTTTTTPFTTSL